MSNYLSVKMSTAIWMILAVSVLSGLVTEARTYGQMEGYRRIFDGLPQLDASTGIQPRSIDHEYPGCSNPDNTIPECIKYGVSEVDWRRFLHRNCCYWISKHCTHEASCQFFNQCEYEEMETPIRPC